MDTLIPEAAPYCLLWKLRKRKSRLALKTRLKENAYIPAHPGPEKCNHRVATPQIKLNTNWKICTLVTTFFHDGGQLMLQRK